MRVAHEPSDQSSLSTTRQHRLRRSVDGNDVISVISSFLNPNASPLRFFFTVEHKYGSLKLSPGRPLPSPPPLPPISIQSCSCHPPALFLNRHDTPLWLTFFRLTLGQAAQATLRRDIMSFFPFYFRLNPVAMIFRSGSRFIFIFLWHFFVGGLARWQAVPKPVGAGQVDHSLHKRNNAPNSMDKGRTVSQRNRPHQEITPPDGDFLGRRPPPGAPMFPVFRKHRSSNSDSSGV